MLADGDFVFRRTDLANQIADGLSVSGLADFRPSLFLFSPPSTGKSTFLRTDLIPACEARGWLPVYVDLMSDQNVDPAELMRRAIGKALMSYAGRVAALAKVAGIERLAIVDDVNWDLTNPRLQANASYKQGLELLHRASDKLVVLIVDEVQQALTSSPGIYAMYALKAARDALKQVDGRNGLRLVFTCSSHDKLVKMVLKDKEPLFGSRITALPLLGIDFIQAYTEHLNACLASSNQLKPEDVNAAFELVGHRPEKMRNLVSLCLCLDAAWELGTLIRDGSQKIQQEIFSEVEISYNSLNLPQRALIEVLAVLERSDGPQTPDSKKTVQAFGQVLQRLGCDVKPTPVNIQAVINELRDKQLVWKSSHGVYALEDKVMADWLINRAKKFQEQRDAAWATRIAHALKAH